MHGIFDCFPGAKAGAENIKSLAFREEELSVLENMQLDRSDCSKTSAFNLDAPKGSSRNPCSSLDQNLSSYEIACRFPRGFFFRFRM